MTGPVLSTLLGLAGGPAQIGRPPLLDHALRVALVGHVIIGRYHGLGGRERVPIGASTPDQVDRPQQSKGLVQVVIDDAMVVLPV